MRTTSRTTNRTRVAAAFIAPALVAGALIIGVGPAQASSAPVKEFANCTAMHKVYAYRGGIKRVGAHDHRSSGTARYAPYVSTKRYQLNSGSDRDKDGVACEV
jgi:excalibur calcium-binding domain-containing protein